MASIRIRTMVPAAARPWCSRLVIVVAVSSAAAVFLTFSVPSSNGGWLVIPTSALFSLSTVQPPDFTLATNHTAAPSPLPDLPGSEQFVYPSTAAQPPFSDTASPEPAVDNSGTGEAKPPMAITMFLNSGVRETESHVGDSFENSGSGEPAPTKWTAESRDDDAKAPPLKPSVRRKPDEELIYAKTEIERPPIVSDDPELYAALFRNISVFKRSYELMERILKVYIYSEGPRPIFHTPQLKGIYASEGWFMKLMEENRRFAVREPNEAHLFYLPYSARQLEEALYKPNSHDMKPLLVFLKNYVDMLSVKYPFWNRTKGADHFIVACHDWGPYTTKLHDEFRKNTIKALCNADISEGVFIRGKDVSLPETSIRMPQKPLKDIGGKRVSRRPFLAFFAGNAHHGRVRPILLDCWSGKDESMRIYGQLPSKISNTMSYIQHMKSSKYCICPMGYEVNSPRIVEAIYYECVPVIIADNFVLPFEEVLNWSAFSIVIAEKDIPKLKDILARISLRKYIYLQNNIKRLQKHFLWHPNPVKYDIFHMILHSVWFNRLNQIQENG
ncbi:putative glycosyltransferase [Apostasia shenzhenica]|uniref:Putative glycosyltransferase n=1 Tax=Apostasia shenzhenica TaxID=1088818 RepID=A0A2I0B7V7_9ASPA|nr:putative glycosyltransferase [Apostasia shenzhenica]